MTKWSEDTTVKFVNEYLKKECLWNGKSPQYKSKFARQKAYMEIKEEMNLPNFGVNEVARKVNRYFSIFYI